MSNGSVGAVETPELAFEYGTVSINDIAVETEPHPTKPGRKVAKHVVINDEPIVPTDRFWTSLAVRFSEYGVSKQLYNLYDHDEVFNRLAERAPSDRLRYTIERRRGRLPVALAVTSPEKPIISYEALTEIVARFGGERITYFDGKVNSFHTPRIGSTNYVVPCPYGKEETHHFRNRFMLEVAVDGYGKPVVMPSLERVEDGVQYVTRDASALKHELNIGKGVDVVHHAVCRALDGFNTDEGYATLRNRVEMSRQSWASVFEAQQGYKMLVKQASMGNLLGQTQAGLGDGESPVLMDFHSMTGDMSQIYGLANLDALAAKKQRNLPIGATVYTLISFFADLATHRASEPGRQALHGFIGALLGDGAGFDMEKSRNKWQDFKDFRINTDLSGVPSTTTAVDE